MAQDPQEKRPVALVTGGARRLGRGIVLALAQDGWDVAVHYGHSAQDAQETVREVEAIGRRAIALAADLDRAAEVAGLLNRCTEQLGEPCCVVNSASRFEYDSVDNFEPDKLLAQMRTNLAAPLLLARDLYRRRVALKAEPASAVVVNLLDQKLFNLNPDFLSYTLSKAALHAATTMLAQALAPLVRVVGVAPGISLPSADQSQADFERAHSATPLGRSSTASDIGQAVCFAARARAVTGTTILVDGGQHLQSMDRDVMFLSR
jgi:NAD(P)-dependent dehydrogenase (short-subunit alcohol dehydrogenase family)